MRAFRIAAVIIGCSVGTALAQEHDVVGKIAVMQSGAIAFDGQPVTLKDLRPLLAHLKAKNGVVWYYREAPHKQAPAISAKVVQMIIDNRLPVSFSTEPDFSTVVDETGTVRRRSRR